MVKGLRHAGLVVKNVNKALYFYGELLGFTILNDQLETGTFIAHILGMPGVEVRTIKMRCGNDGVLELLCFDRLSPVAGIKKLTRCGFTHIALTVKNLDELHMKLIGSGIQFISYPSVSGDNKAKVAFCRDLERNFIELVQELN